MRLLLGVERCWPESLTFSNTPHERADRGSDYGFDYGLDCGLDYGLYYGLDYGLDYRLDYGLYYRLDIDYGLGYAHWFSVIISLVSKDTSGTASKGLL